MHLSVTVQLLVVSLTWTCEISRDDSQVNPVSFFVCVDFWITDITWGLVCGDSATPTFG